MCQSFFQWVDMDSMSGGSYVVTFVCIVGEILLISNRRRTLEKQYSLIHDINGEKDKE